MTMSNRLTWEGGAPKAGGKKKKGGLTYMEPIAYGERKTSRIKAFKKNYRKKR